MLGSDVNRKFTVYRKKGYVWGLHINSVEGCVGRINFAVLKSAFQFIFFLHLVMVLIAYIYLTVCKY